jgi:hypothetical protein
MWAACSLCGERKELRASHLIPKFVGSWLKKTSGTGYLVSAAQASKRVQDLLTLRLLCHDCEQRFSKLEAYFAKQIFFPFHKKKARSFTYDSRLESFVISLSWRALKISYEEFKTDQPQLSSFVDQAELYWREFLLGRRKSISPYESHLIFFDYIEKGDGIPPRFNWYTLRAVDATLAANSKRVFAYVKLPWMILIASIHPAALEGWHGTAIKESGTISTPQTINDGVFGRFLLDRAAISHISSPGPSPELARDRLLRAIKRDAQKFLESDTLQTVIAEVDLQRKDEEHAQVCDCPS